MAASAAISRLRLPGTTFLLCDVQERFRPLIHRFADVVEVSSFMVRAARVLGAPVVVTEQYPRALGHTVPEIELGGEPPIPVIDKTQFSMCIPPVEALLAENATESVVLFGIESHVCVQQTALDLLANGVNVHVLEDGVSSQRPNDRAAALRRMERAGAVITTAESVVFELMGDTTHPGFRAMSALLKERSQGVISSL